MEERPTSKSRLNSEKASRAAKTCQNRDKNRDKTVTNRVRGSPALRARRARARHALPLRRFVLPSALGDSVSHVECVTAEQVIPRRAASIAAPVGALAPEPRGARISFALRGATKIRVLGVHCPDTDLYTVYFTLK